MGRLSDGSSPNREPRAGRLRLHRTGLEVSDYNGGTGHELPQGIGIAYGLRLDAIASD
jgi:hypothetical protein